MGKEKEVIDSKENIDRDKNVISHNEFGSLEKNEDKKKGLKKLFSKKKKKEEKKEEKEETPDAADANMMAILKMIKKQKDVLEKLGVSIGKLEGKFELEQDTEHAINNRISDLSSRIGELNSMVLTRERKMDKIELEFENLREELRDVRPERIRKMFKEKDENILINQAKIEKIKVISDGMSKELKEYKATMSKVRSFENLLNTLGEIDEKIKEIDATKKYTDRMTSKVEMLFAELKKKLTYLDSHEDKISYLEDVNQHMVKSLDQYSMKMSKHIDKEEFDKVVDKINKQNDIVKADLKKAQSIVDSATKEVKTDIRKTKELVDMATKEVKGTKAIMDKFDYVKLTKKIVEFDKKMNRLDSLTGGLKSIPRSIRISTQKKLANRLNKTDEKISRLKSIEEEIPTLDRSTRKFYNLISESYNLLRNNELSKARQNYLEAMSIFSQLSSDDRKIAHKKIVLLHQSLSRRISQKN